MWCVCMSKEKIKGKIRRQRERDRKDIKKGALPIHISVSNLFLFIGS